MKSTHKKPVFKTYNPHQQFLLPPSLDELISQRHPVRLVGSVIDEIDLDILSKQYKGGGTSSYHPRMLLKVLVYGYLSNIYSSRKLEAACKENIHFMFLSGMSYPDHHTINRFRSERLKHVLKEVFAQVVFLLNETGQIELKDIYTDGTKIEANANRYSFVWGKAIKTSQERIARQLEELWSYSQQVAKAERQQTPPDFNDTDPEKVRQTIQSINQALRDKEVDPKVKQKLNYAAKNWPAKLEQYARQKEIMGERNSYSKTDPDATFMRMKEDHMLNGQLKPGYNLQISTHKQFIVNYSIHQKPTDTTTLIPHLEAYKKMYGFHPKQLTADAGYGSHQNYTFLERENIEAFVKYGSFAKEQQQPITNLIGHPDQLHYDAQGDCYFCPMGQKMDYIGTVTKVTAAGFNQELSRYRAQNCSECPLHGPCHKQQGNRIMEVNQKLNRLKATAREKLLSPQGIAKRKQRCYDVEPVFGNIKHNKNFKRFMLRGCDKVEIEAGLLALAHNMKKWAA